MKSFLHIAFRLNELRVSLSLDRVTREKPWQPILPAAPLLNPACVNVSLIDLSAGEGIAAPPQL